MRSLALALCLSAAVAAPVVHAQSEDAMATADRLAAQQVDQARTNVKAHPGAAYEATVFSQQVVAAFIGGSVKRKKLDGKALVGEADGYLDAAMKAHPDDTPRLLTVRGSMYQEAGRKAEATALFKKASDAAVAQAQARAKSGAAPVVSARPGIEAPSGPTWVSVQVSSACPKAVNLGSGADPMFASPNPWQAKFAMPLNFRPGDSVYIFDDARKVVASAKIGEKTKTVTINENCTSLTAKE